MNANDAKPAELGLEEKIIALESNLSKERAKIKALQTKLGTQQLMSESIMDAIKEYPAPVPQKIMIAKQAGDRKTLSEAVFQFGDKHIGDYVTEDRTDNWGKFNFDIGRHRANLYVDKCVRWVTDCRKAGWNIQDATIIDVGDHITGNIHEELKMEAEFPLPVQQIRAGQINSEIVLRLAPHFKKITVHILAGNHDRLTLKKQFKGRMENSAAYVVAEYMRAKCQNIKNLELNTVMASPKLIHINQHGFLISHGDNTKAWMGMPWYGIDRAEGREAKRRMQMMIEEQKNVGYEYIVGGHWHTPSHHNNWLFSGSLRGTDEYDHEAGRYAAPTWLSYLVHKKRGVFNNMHWRVDK